MRRIFSLGILCSLLLQMIPLTHADGAFYLVTAYYSPEAGQDFYLHETYEDEIKMNGQGTTTASGKAVAIGSVAAPKDVAFGTRVHIDQKITIKGVSYDLEFHGTVTDRGGAITSGSKLPRLDIYVGKGQKGLCRALNFGVQTVYLELDNDTTEPDTKSLDFLSTDCKNPHNQSVPVASGVKKPFDPFTMTITAGSATENIKIVQTLLKKANAYSGDIDGIYGPAMIEAIYQFQKDQGIVTSRNDDGAGLYGPKTRSALKALVGDSYKPSNPTSTTTNTTTTSTPTSTGTSTTTTTTSTTGNTTTTGTSTGTTTTTTTPTTSTATDSIFSGNVFDGSKSSDIRELQKVLNELGYFPYDPDGLYNKRLVDGIYKFQLERKIVESETEQGAGYYGPVTKSTVEEAYSALLAKRAKIASTEAAIIAAKAEQVKATESKRQEFVDMINKIPSVKLNQVDPEVRTLQKILKDLGYLNVNDTAIYGPLTKSALAKYQFDLKVIDSINSQYAGVIGDKTRAAIAEDLFQRWLKVNAADSNAEIKKLEAELAELKKS